jgi:hypothetical protein
MEQLKIAKPNAHPARMIFKINDVPRMIFKINDVPLKEVSKALNLSYSYVCSMLAGSRIVPSHIDLKLHELAGRVEEQYGKNTPNEQTINKDKDQLG